MYILTKIMDIHFYNPNPTRPSVQKMVKRTLKILQQHLLQDFQQVFDHFVDTRRCRVKIICYQFFKRIAPGTTDLLKVNNRNTRTRCKICSKLTIKTTRRRSGVLIINFEYFSHLFLVFLLITLNMQLPAGSELGMIKSLYQNSVKETTEFSL